MLTQDEAELYDRQIRLWGVNAQSRLRQSKVLMLGFNGVASEVAKILVLAGIDTLTIVDDSQLQDSDLTSNLFCRPIEDPNNASKDQYRTHLVTEKLRRLNPLVKVNIENSPILSKKAEDFKHFDLVSLHSFMAIEEVSSINRACREQNIKFYLVLDYGFFGFMFNDLGSEFKFAYEEYDKISNGEQKSIQDLATKQSGGELDPINFDDEEENDDIDGSDDDKRHDSNRPKKRRRHFSPQRSEIATKDKNEKKHKADKLDYVTFEDMISCKGSNFDKKSSPVLFITIAMFKFFSEFGRLPCNCISDNQSGISNQKDYDLSKLNEYIASMKDSLNLHETIFKKLDSDWSLHMSGSLSPVCAIVGGVAGQDMIRSLSGKDIPIYNTFSFDGMDMSGVVERLGMNDVKVTAAAPIIRDFLEID